MTTPSHPKAGGPKAAAAEAFRAFLDDVDHAAASNLGAEEVAERWRALCDAMDELTAEQSDPEVQDWWDVLRFAPDPVPVVIEAGNGPAGSVQVPAELRPWTPASAWQAARALLYGVIYTLPRQEPQPTGAPGPESTPSDPGDGGEERSLRIVTEAMHRWNTQPPVRVEIDKPTLYALIGGLQLLTRHPGLPPRMIERFVSVARQMQEHLADDPDIYNIIENGWNPDHDVTQDEEQR